MPLRPWFSAPELEPSAWLRKLDKPNTVRLCKVLKLIKQRAERWRSLDLNLHSTYLNALFPSTRNFPSLEKLVTRSPTVPFAKLDPPFLSHDMPMLRELRLYENTAPALAAFPWAQLTVFVTDEISVSDCVNIFRHTSNLTYCTVRVVHDSSLVSIPPLHPITNLHDLSIHDEWEDAEDFPLIKLLQHLTLPALKRLSLRFEVASPEDTSAFIYFASRSLFKLEQLTLRFPDSADTVLELLRSMSCLRSLDIEMEDVRDADKICGSLTSRPNFLPMLQFLRIIYLSSELVGLTTLGDMFRSNWTGVSEKIAAVGMRSFVFRHPTREAEFGALVKTD
jgi:hypothetical protein